MVQALSSSGFRVADAARCSEGKGQGSQNKQ